MPRNYERALAKFGENVEAFAAKLNAESARPETIEEDEERGNFYWSEEDQAWQSEGDPNWDFIGSVAWEDGKWVADYQEHE